MKNKILVSLLTISLIFTSTSFIFANDEVEKIEESVITEQIEEEVVEEEPQVEEVEEIEEKVEEPIVEETSVEKTETETLQKNSSTTMTKKPQEEEEEVAYYSWHSEDEQGNTATPKFVNVNPDVTEQDFETNQSVIVLEAYDKDGNNIESKNQYIPIDKIERTIEGDVHHPGLNSVVETLTYNDTYSETIYHTLYTFVTVNYIEKVTNKILHNWNYEVISWGFKFSEEDEGIAAITANMSETEKTNFYNQFYSPHQDTRYQTWNVSDWDKIDINGYDYIETVGAIVGTFADLVQQHNIFVYYQEHIDNPEPEPEPEPEPTPQPEPTPTPEPTPEPTPIPTPTPVPQPEPTAAPSQPTQRVAAVVSEPAVESEPTVESAPAPKTTIPDSSTPKARPIGSWALINLIATILSCLIAIFLIFVKKEKEDDEEEYTDEEKDDIRIMRLFKIMSLIFGVLSIIIFIFTEDMSLPMVLVDKWTLLMILLLIIEIVNIFIIRRKSKGEESDD